MTQSIKPRSWFRSLVLFAAFLAFISGFFVLADNFFASDLEVPRENIISSMSAPVAGIPVRLKIPSIGVDAPVEPEGLTKGGAMDVPEGPRETGWFSLGPRPGDRGSAVIAGHRGFRTGPAVFDDLHKLKTGDEVRVVDESGKELVFVVRETKVYGAKEIVPEVWHSDDAPHLNLITCSGKFSRITGTSEKRLVVFTDLVI